MDQTESSLGDQPDLSGAGELPKGADEVQDAENDLSGAGELPKTKDVEKKEAPTEKKDTLAEVGICCR